MKKQWIMFVLTAVGAVVVGLWIYRKINPSPNVENGVARVPSGGAGSQSATPGGYKLESPLSTIFISPATVVQKSDMYDVDFVNSLPRG